jgi:hypothetical protein
MATYRVAFDGEWQEDFDYLDDAVPWAREVADTGRLVHVVKKGLLRYTLVAVFPEDKGEIGEKRWRRRPVGYSSDSRAGWVPYNTP